MSQTSNHVPPPAAESVEDREERGRSLRERVPRSAHAGFSPSAERPDPIAILEESAKDRVPELLPIRYARMSESPFAFLRGAAAIMAVDLSTTPSTGLRAQLGGDAHLMNFGAYEAAGGGLIFDVNDFDETLPGPWEWDLKRLAASVAVAARSIKLSVTLADDAVAGTVAAYRERMLQCAGMTPLDVWHSRIDSKAIAAVNADVRTLANRIAQKARSNTQARAFPKLTRVVDGQRRIIDEPPLIYHDEVAEHAARVRRLFAGYRSTLRREQQVLFERYDYVDVAMKVVGVGSVGTRCYIALFMASGRDPLFLQLKAATASVLEPYAGKSEFEAAGHRVVTGQRLMQASSDILLGWMTEPETGQGFYVRQLRDMQASAEVADMSPAAFAGYAKLCGLTLARAHARSGDPAAIAGYVGRGDALDRALVKFASAYADQTERDYEELLKAIRTGRIPSADMPLAK